MVFKAQVPSVIAPTFATGNFATGALASASFLPQKDKKQLVIREMSLNRITLLLLGKEGRGLVGILSHQNDLNSILLLAGTTLMQQLWVCCYYSRTSSPSKKKEVVRWAVRKRT